MVVSALRRLLTNLVAGTAPGPSRAIVAPPPPIPVAPPRRAERTSVGIPDELTDRPLPPVTTLSHPPLGD